MAKAKASTEEFPVAPSPVTALSTNVDYGEDAGAGYGEHRPDEVQLPFLGLLQDLSPQITGAKGEHLLIKDARPGHFFNTVTAELLGTAVEFVPAYKERAFVEYKPNRGGFVSRHKPDDTVVVEALAAAAKFGKYKTKEGNDLTDTVYLYGVVCRDGEPLFPAVLAFSSTKWKVFRTWNSQVKMFQVPLDNGRKQQPPIFAHSLKITSARQTNDKGTFFNLVITPTKGSIKDSILSPDDPRFLAAKAIKNMVVQGKAKVAEETQADGEEETVGEVF